MEFMLGYLIGAGASWLTIAVALVLGIGLLILLKLLFGIE
jgi:hypothetical protein